MSRKRTLIFTDIHGCNATFRALLEEMDPGNEDQLCFLGDYIDRGPDSKGVIDTIWEWREKVDRLICLRGNHEQLLLEGLDDACSLAVWMANGGRETLDSFQAKTIADIPSDYINFFHSTSHFAEVENAILVHAGLNFITSDGSPYSDLDGMLWIRNWYKDINYDWLGERMVIHGHTPVSDQTVRAMAKDFKSQQYLNLDSGCVYDEKGYGHLSAYDLTNDKLYMCKRIS
ncbi:MAG: serine/threonine protein phosphatase [Bacteroidetes bacterium]|nr:serine/threonine protein phosphatase [Bacteroidota bacterium]